MPALSHLNFACPRNAAAGSNGRAVLGSRFPHAAPRHSLKRQRIVCLMSNVSWFKAMRSDDIMELLRCAPNAFRLAFVIAYRARFSSGFSADELERGEAMLGDFASYGMTQQEYRTAKAQLEKWNFATFRATTKGTLGRLIGARLFDPLNLSTNEPNNERATAGQRSINERVTTNKNGKKERNREEGRAKPARCSSSGQMEFEKPTFEQMTQFCESTDFPSDFDTQFAEQFFHEHERDGWTIRRKPIRFWKMALIDYCRKLQSDRERI